MRRCMWWLLSGACAVDPALDTPTLPSPTGDSGSRIDCAPSLAVQPVASHVGHGGVLQLLGSGGTGAYRYALAAPALGEVNPTLGTYVAPSRGTGVDTVVLTDEGCVGEARAEVTVGVPFEVLPERATVRPGTAFRLEATDRPPQAFRCAMVSGGSGGTVSADCAYQAGSSPGVDWIRVSDELGPAVVDVTITVDPEAELALWGHEHWVLPLGSTFRPRSEGGSGVLDLTVSDAAVVAEEGSLQAVEPGSAEVRVTDRFAGFTHTVSVDVIAPYQPASPFTGQRAFQGEARGPGDLNGDGYPDAIVSNPEINGGAFYSGAVMVYAGTEGGLEPEPVWVTSGPRPFGFHGRAIEVADLDGDGQLDLAVGADGADLAGSSVGLVRIYRGIVRGFFETEPWLQLRGVYGGDAAGSALAACDYDGDGFTDLAVGAYLHEERTDEPGYPVNTGAVLLFRGHAGGLGAEPTAIRYGRRVDRDTGTWVAVGDSRAGLWGMAAGDVDGDGDCELAVATSERALYADQTDRPGFVALYDGLPSAEGTLSAEPIRAYAILDDGNAALGRSVAMGDIDGDGRADLAVGAYAWDGGRSSSGGVLVFLAKDADRRASTAPYTPADASWSVTGPSSGSYLGLRVRVRDVDGDGYADVTSGAPRAPHPGGASVRGRVLTWSGQTIAQAPDRAADEPLVDVGGPEAEGYFGQAAAPIGDLDGDQRPDVVVLAGRTDTHGVDVGGVFFAPGSGARPTELELPGEASGHEHGRAMAIFEADGDGRDDLVVGSPSNAVGSDLYHGTTTVFSGLGAGFDRAGWTFGEGMPDQGSYDRRGYALSGESDFNGDGYADLAVVSYTDPRPAGFSSAYDNPTECPGSISQAGSVRVHLGGPGGVAEQAAFVFYGPDDIARTSQVASGFDHDGDGYQDLLVGSWDWLTDGGVAVVHGRPQVAGITVICEAERWSAVESGARFASGIAAIGDVDGDGCDEVAVGAQFEDAGPSNQGVVRVLWGHGAGCANPEPEVTTLGPGVSNAWAGWSLAGGGDVDGDGVPDLAVGGPGMRQGSTELGGAWVVPGSWLTSLPRQSAVGGLPAGGAIEVQPLTPPTGTWGVLGPSATGRFGSAVALVDDVQTGRKALAIGIPQGDEGGVAFAGGAHVVRFVDGGLETVPSWVIGGETQAPVGRLGEGLWSGAVDGRPVLLVGARLSSVVGLNQGAAYVVELD